MRNKQLRIIAVVNVRMGSTRLPGKVMMNILGKPVLGYLIERVKRAKLIDQVVIATSVNPENDQIELFCQQIGVACFRGSENDVLNRMLKALQAHQAEVGVEVYGDCPLIDPAIIDAVVKFYVGNQDKYDFVGNDLKTTFPPGTEVEVYSIKALEDAAQKADSPEIREHGTLYIRQHPEVYRLYNIEAPVRLRYPQMEIELDTMDDFTLIKNIIENLYPEKPEFSTYDVIKFLKQRPGLARINKNVTRRWRQLRGQ